jgi:hypothetical protein
MLKVSSLRCNGHSGVFTACLIAVALLFVNARLADAQALYGSIVGNVTDGQGALTPGVTLTAINTGTGLEVETVSDADGAYTFRNLLPGTYDLKASLAGFREHKQTAIPVTAGNPVRVNIALVVGALTETVMVAADTTLLQTDKADLSTQLGSKEITTLPLNQYRNYQALLNLVPGATPAQFQNAEIDSPGRSLRTWVNGTQPNSNATRIDGAVSVNIWLPHHVGYVQPAETIETVNVSTNSFDAEYGMAGGASATVVTKSGTNEVRGSAFWFGNTDELNANSYFNNAFSRAKDPLTRNIYGGTVGGPVVHNKLFYFGSFERFADRRGSLTNYAVPTARMRDGDFGEVAAAYNTTANPSRFLLFNPYTGTATGTNRTQFPNYQIPGSLINPVARQILNYFPLPNTTADLNSNLLLDDYQQFREVRADRDNYDLKMTWQRSASHSMWGKFAMLDAEVIDNFALGFDEGSLGDTRVYVVGLGHTWTLSPTLVLDGNFGANIQNQTVTGPDYGEDLGLGLGIRGSNGNDIRQSGLPFFDAGYQIGTTPNWMPLFRKERSYTFSTAVTKVFQKHDVRLGVDVVRHALNHVQAEFGDIGGVRGGFRFNGTVTGINDTANPYSPLLWNTFGTFLLGLQTYGGKDVQTEEMTGREWQSAIYLRDRWQVSSNFTVSAGLRLEHYPLMSRVGRGIERLDLSTYEVLLGGVGSTPDDVGINLKTWYFAPRLGAMYRMGEKAVARVGYGRTINPLPWSRPMRGSFPQDIFFNRTANQFAYLGSIQDGIPAVPVPDLSSGRVALPRGVFMRTPNPNDVDRGVIQQWNVAYEYKLPGDIAAEVAYVGTRTDGGYADLNINYGTPGGGNESRQYFGIAGTTAINDWAARTKSRYHGLQVAVNRPLRNGLLLKGAYTYSKSKNMADEDGWVGLTWNSPLMYDRNFATAGFDRPHVMQLGFVYTLPFMETSTSVAGRLAQGWQINGVVAAYSGTPFTVEGTNTALNCPACGTITINYNGDASPTGTPGANGQAWYPVANFSQPVGADVAGFGNTGRNFFRRPGVWNVDLSVFKTFQVGRWRPEFRLEMANAFNHTTWGRPIIAPFGAPNYMQFVPQSTVVTDGNNQMNTPGPRRIQIGLRTQF